MANLRAKLNAAIKDAMREKVPARLSTLRLINAAIKDRDIEARAEGNENGVSDDIVITILDKMTKQRRESARAYEEGGRIDLATRELSEIEIISEFLPRKLDDDEVQKAIEAAITSEAAQSLRDMGKVMGALKAKYTGQIDFSSVGPMIKSRLGG